MEYDYDSLSKEDFTQLENIYKLFGSVPRLKMLLRLNDGPATASELSTIADLSQSAASHQLKDLKNCKIIKSHKEGKNVIYSLDDHHILHILISGIEHIKGKHCDV